MTAKPIVGAEENDDDDEEEERTVYDGPDTGRLPAVHARHPARDDGFLPEFSTCWGGYSIALRGHLRGEAS